MKIAAVISTAKAIYREVKLTVYGRNIDVRTASAAAPYGTDSNPIAGMRAIYADTAINGNPVCIGYLNKSLLAGVGEHRVFSTDAQGNVKIAIWLKNDGTCEIGGNANHMVQYEALNSKLQDVLTQINSQLALIQLAIGNVGGTYAKVNITEDFSSAKLENIKTQ